MNKYKRHLALLLSLLLLVSPINSVYAVNSNAFVGEEFTTPTKEVIGEETQKPPTTDGGSTEEQVPPATPDTDGSTEEVVPPMEILPPIFVKPTGEIKFSHSFVESDTKWVTGVSDLVVSFEYSHGVKSAKVVYTVGDTTTEVPAEKSPEGLFSATIPSSSIGDGYYTVKATSTFEDDSEETKEFSFKVDTTPVDYSKVVVEGLIVKDNKVAYTKDSYSISGFADPLSGVKSIKVVDGEGTTIDCDISKPLTILDGYSSIIMEDNAGNKKEVSISDILKELNICDSVVFDSKSPEVDISVSGGNSFDKDGLTYYWSEVSVSVSSSDQNLKTVSVMKNDELVENLPITGGNTTKEYVFSENGNYKIVVTSSDYSGNSFSKESVFAIDTTAPSKGTMHASGKWVESDGRVYTSGEVTIDGTPEDLMSGVKSISVLKNGKSVSSQLPCVLTESGSYSVEVKDNLDNSIIVQLNELLGTTSNELVFDNELPEVSFNINKTTKPDFVDERGNWYKGNPTVVVSAKDSNMKSVKVVADVDGTETEIYNGSENIKNVTVPTDTLSGNKFVLKITATDLSGNSSTDTFAYFVDGSAPVLESVTSPSPSFQKGGNVYFNATFNVSVVAEDSGVGGVRYILNKEENLSGVFEVSKSGEYSIQAVDALGNKSDPVLLGDKCGWSGNYVIINKLAPSIEMAKNGGAWLSKPFVYDVTVKSDIGINSVVISVNGSEVVNKSYQDTTTTKESFSINTADVEKSEDSSYTVIVTVTDNSGLVGTETDVTHVDTAPPSKGTIDVSGRWNVVGGKVYLNEKVLLSGDPSDSESGIKSVEVLRDGKPVGFLPYVIDSSGVYSVKVTDNVGNVSEFSFADIAGIDSSDIVWDNGSPEVSFDMDETDMPQFTSGSEYWYMVNPTVVINMSDDNLESVSVVCYADGTPVTMVSEVSDNGVYTIDTSKVDGKDFKIIATAKDKSGNVSEQSYSYHVDHSDPDIGTLTVTAIPDWRDAGEFVYTRGEFLFKGIPVDADSGVKNAYLYKEGSLVATFSGGDVDFHVSKEEMSGSYYVVLEDNVGNRVTVNANELLGSASNKFIVDLTSPSIERVDNNKETADGWYNYTPVLAYNLFDAHLSSYRVTVNGDEVAKGSKSEKVEVDTSKYQNMEVKVVISVQDIAGNESSYTYSYRHDNTPPSGIKVEISKPVSFKGGNVYYNAPVEMKISANDYHFGGVRYFVNGNLAKDGVYKISESGEYSIEAVDGLGNSTGIVTLQDILGWSGNHIVLDSAKPVISAEGYNGSWITGTGVYKVSVSDDLGLDRISVIINGSNVLDRSISEVDDTEEYFVVDTSMSSPDDNGSYDIAVYATDNSGLASVWRDTVYVDNTSPSIDGFTFSGYVNSLNSEGGYNYFFNGSGSVKIHGSDSSFSSGVRAIWVRIGEGVWVEYPVNADGSVDVKIPADFKGTIEAYSVDNVGLQSATRESVKIISESANSHKDGSKVLITLPETPYSDENGLPLYNSDFSAFLSTACSWSGIKEIQWGIDDLYTIDSFNTGDKDLNITTKYGQSIPLVGNANGITVNAYMTDWSGHTSAYGSAFSIDKDAPVISVSYDNTVANGHYRESRIAYVSIKDRNFDPSLVSFGGSYGSVSSWSRDGDVWYCTISFTEDGDYGFTIDSKDRANNQATQFVSENFTVDKTSPVIGVSWNLDTPVNGLYYRESRVATITVTERNFDASGVSIQGTGVVSGWSSSGDTHTAAVSFSESGEHTLTVSGSDLAGNSSETVYESGKFIVDLDKPVIEVVGVSNGVSYKNSVEFIVRVSDTYINSGTRVYLKGKNHEELEVQGVYSGNSAVFSFSDFPKTEDIDDIYTIRVVAKDNADNISEEVVVFSVNRFGSKYSFYNEDLLNNYINNPVDIEIHEVNVDRLDMSKVVVVVTRDGKEVELDPRWVSVTEEEIGNKYNYKYKINKDAFTEDGKYSVSIFSQSNDGTKYTSVSEQYDFIIDRTAPEVIISGVQENGNYHEYSRTVTVDVRDLSGIGSIKFFVNDEEVTNFTEDSGIYSFDVLESGEYQSVSVTVTDMAGNITESSIKNFLITSNTIVYLLNQVWFMVLLAILLFIVVLMTFMLFSNRRKVKDDELEAVKASDELYRSSSTASSNSLTSGDDQDNKTTDLLDE